MVVSKKSSFCSTGDCTQELAYGRQVPISSTLPLSYSPSPVNNLKKKIGEVETQNSKSVKDSLIVYEDILST